MDLKKYEKIRKKVVEHGFESKYKNLDKWLFGSSFLGNVGSIFFAYFLVFPALNKAISTNLTEGKLGLFLGVLSTVVILTLFEYIKRIVVKNLSFDIVKKELTKSILWLVFSVAIIGASAWLSINGAVNFASTTKKYEFVTDTTYNSMIDSVHALYDTKILPYKTDNDTLRNINTRMRNKLLETPLNYANTRKGYNDIINDNLKVIANNEILINKLLDDKSEILNKVIKEKTIAISQYSKTVESDQLIFFIVAFSIELIIILGIYFREYFDYNIYLIHENELEQAYRKINNYKILLNFIFKNGDVKVGDQVVATSKLKELVKESSNIPNPNKFIETFITEITYIGIIRLNGKKRFANMSMLDAIKKIENLDKNVKILEQLK
jgi:hypothetical protein